MKQKAVWGAGIGIVVAGVFISWSYGQADVWRGVLWGTFISSILNLLGFIAVRHSFERSFKRLLSAIVGGLLIRMVIILVSAFYIRQYPSISIMWFLVSFLGCFFIYQGMEVMYFVTRGPALSTEKS